MGRTTDKGWAAGSVLQVESFDRSLQASNLAVPAFVHLEPLSSSEYGLRFRSALQRGNVWLRQRCPYFILCVARKILISVHLFIRLFMFLHWKKKARSRVKGSTWLPVMASCGTTTGKIKSVFEATVLIMMESTRAGPTPTLWYTAMKLYQKAPCVNCISTWNSTSPRIKEPMERLWFLDLSGYAVLFFYFYNLLLSEQVASHTTTFTLSFRAFI